MFDWISLLMTPRKATLDSMRTLTTLSWFVSYRRPSPQFHFSVSAAALGTYLYGRNRLSMQISISLLTFLIIFPLILLFSSLHSSLSNICHIFSWNSEHFWKLFFRSVNTFWLLFSQVELRMFNFELEFLFTVQILSRWILKSIKSIT